MTIASAISNLFKSVFDIIAGLFNAVLAIVQTIWAAIYGVLRTALASADAFLRLLWSAFPILLVIGLTILVYQIFVVDKGRAGKVGAGRKKVA